MPASPPNSNTETDSVSSDQSLHSAFSSAIRQPPMGLQSCPQALSITRVGGMAGLERKDRPICRTQEPGVHKAIHAISMDVQPRCLSNVPGAKWASLSPQNETQFPLAIREMLRGRLVSEGAPPCWVSVLVSCCSSAGHQCCTSGVTIRPHFPPHPSDSHFATF